MAVTLGAITTATLAGGGVTTTTFSFASTANPLYVRLGFWNGGSGGTGGGTVSGITFNTVALTRIVQTGLSNGNDRAEIWRLTAPGATTSNIVVTTASMGTGPGGNATAANAAGLDGSTPEGTPATNQSASNGLSTGALTIAGAVVGDLIMACMGQGGGTVITPAKTGGGTLAEEYDAAFNGEECEGFKVPDAVTDVSASWTGSTGWAIAAIPLKAPAATGLPPGLGPEVGMPEPFHFEVASMR